MEFVALLSDIHGNATALEAVMRDLEQQPITRCFVLGDLAYRGAEPKRSIALVQSLECPVIGGNADLWVTRGLRPGEVRESAFARMSVEREWTVEQLASKDIAYLAELPDIHEETVDGLHFSLCHATPTDRFRVIGPHASDDELRSTFLAPDGLTAHFPQIVSYGHIHLPYIRHLDGCAVINPGSVGLPFDGLPLASYAIVQIDRGQIAATAIRRVRYDIEVAVDALKRVGYPEAGRLERALRTGAAP